MKKSDEKILESFKDHLTQADEFWGPIHASAREYKSFTVAVDGMWTPDEKSRMGEPVVQTNRLLAYVNLIVNSAVQQEIGCNVEPVSEGASAQLALVRQSQIMTLWNKGGGKMASSRSLREAVWGSFGVMKTKVGYAGKTGHNKTIRWDALLDPTMFRCDPSAKDPALSDMCYAIEEHTLSKKGFQKLYGSRYDKLDRDTEAIFEKGTRQKVYEYWILHDGGYDEFVSNSGKSITKKEYDSVPVEDPESESKPEPKPDLLLDESGEPISRRVSTGYVEQILIGNNRVLKRIPWLGSRIPYKVSLGLVVALNGQVTLQAMTTHAIGPQKKYNFLDCQKAIMFSKGPQEIVFVPAEGSVGELQNKLNDIAINGSTNLTVIPYKSLTDEGNPIPAPHFKAQILGDPILYQESMLAVQEIEACFGMSPNSWINPNPSASGIAIQEREAQGETSQFEFNFNWLSMLEETFRDALEIIPKLSISMQVKLAAGVQKEKVVWVNNPAAATSEIENYDLDDDEEYALSIKVSPSPKTMRNQAWDQMMMFVKNFPQAAVAIPDLALKAGTNNIYTDAMAQRLEKMVPKELMDEQPDPQVAALMMQLQQSQAVIQEMQTQLKFSVDTVRTLNENLKLEKTKAQTDTVTAVMDNNIKKMQLSIDEQQIQIDQYKAETERIEAENERAKAVQVIHLGTNEMMADETIYGGQ